MGDLPNRVTDLSLEAFIVRLYREKNQTGFLEPSRINHSEHITRHVASLKNTVKELQPRKVHIYRHFHEEIKNSPERRKADVIELYHA